MAVRLLLLQAGHIESQTLSMLPVSHVKGFGTVREALIDLGQALLAALRDDVAYGHRCMLSIRRCCSVNDPCVTLVCPSCGTSLTPPETTHQDLANWVRHIVLADCDSSNAAYQHLTDAGWEFGLPSDRSEWSRAVHVFEHADAIIASLVIPPGEGEAMGEGDDWWMVSVDAPRQRPFNPDCPYDHHADDCDCRGMGGDR